MIQAELEEKLREEFEEYFAATKPYQFSILKDKKKTEFEISKLKFSIGYVSARKKAQEEISQLKEEFEKLHSFCLNYQIYIHDILHSVNVFKSFHDLRKGAHAYAVSMDKEPKWDYQDTENTDYFNGLKSYVVQLKEQIASAKEIKQYPTALTYISELKEELKRERLFSSKFEIQSMKGYPTPKEWSELSLENMKNRQQRKADL